MYNETLANRPVNFIERYCSHVEDSWSAKKGELIKLSGWNKKIIQDFFGTIREDTGYRQYKYLWLEVPKKNAKSIITSGIGLYVTGFDNEMGAENVVIAADKLNARIIFDASTKMIELNPFLEKEFRAYKDAIEHIRTGGVLKVLSAEGYNKHGPKLHFILFDEVHAQATSELYDTLSKGVASKAQPGIIMCTTAGIKETWPHTMHLFAKDIFTGAVENPYWLVKIYGGDDNVDIFDLKEWEKHNPNFGVSINPEYAKEQILLCRTRPSEISVVKRLHFNIWTGSSVEWELMKHWETGNIRPVTVESLAGRTAWGGLDCARVNDLNSFSIMVEPTGQDPLWHWLRFSFISTDSILERKKRQHHFIEQWVDEGKIIAAGGKTTDKKAIIKKILYICSILNIREIGFDPNKADEVVTGLEENDIPCRPYSQNMPSMHMPTAEIERLIMEGELNHAGDPVLRWEAGNVMMVQSGDDYKPDKKSSNDKIDCIISGVIAMGTYMTRSDDEESIIQKGGVVWV